MSRGGGWLTLFFPPLGSSAPFRIIAPNLHTDPVGAPGICSIVWPVIWEERLLWNRALVWCLAGIDYEMPELGSNDLVTLWGLDFVRGARLLHYINSGRSETCREARRYPTQPAIDLVMAHHYHRLIYQEGTLVGGPNGSTLSSSYSLKEIVPERDPIPMIDLSNSELVDRLDPSEPESNSKMIPEPERKAPMDVEGTGTFVVGGFPIAASLTPVLPAESVSSFPAIFSLLRGGVKEHDTCGYCLWREQRVEIVSQQIAELKKEVSRMDALFYTARQTRCQETARAAMLEMELVQMREAYAA
ncbi:hypothetical protein M9H77_26070 [Catharanthus roseus]|uniref:Uncharacterized protein n=1 Tax=Catharanthus roseus TaxID=4058 RepID=A0ACC0AA07_CATRO|nr:hypothetical protein M9H77_26070 [Catharanthus roseus]